MFSMNKLSQLYSVNLHSGLADPLCAACGLTDLGRTGADAVVKDLLGDPLPGLCPDSVGLLRSFRWSSPALRLLCRAGRIQRFLLRRLWLAVRKAVASQRGGLGAPLRRGEEIPSAKMLKCINVMLRDVWQTPQLKSSTRSHVLIS